jgi:putative membrane protein
VAHELDHVAVLRLTALAAASLPLAAFAHHPAGAPPPGWSTWSLEPWVLVLLAGAAVLYVIGVTRLWRRAGRGRGVTVPQALRFAAGWTTLAIALLSPVDAMGGALFSVHMVQHELLMVVAAPLLVTARTLEAWTWALAPRWRRLAGAFFHTPAWSAGWRVLVDPMGAWLVHAIVLWAWHVPVFFEAALGHDGLHALQHASFLASALLFWWSVFVALARFGAGLASVFTTMLHTGGLGALLTFAPSAWYPHYVNTAVYGLTALEDQQLGGLLMWGIGGLPYFAVGLAIVARWLLPSRAPAFR